MSPEEEEEEPEVTCPVCGNTVSLEDEFCPHCGAEFEEEEVEEIVEVEEYEEEPAEEAEEEVKEEVKEEVEVEEYKEEPAEEPEEEAYTEAEEEYEEPEEVEVYEEEPLEDLYYEEEEAVEEAPAAAAAPATSLFDLRGIGVALLILGIVCTIISLFIKQLWEFVPPIDEKLGAFSLIGLLIIVIGFIGFSMIRKSISEGKRVSSIMPSALLGVFLFGILALLMILANNPINDAMGSSPAGMAGIFIVVLIVGVIVLMMGQKRAASAAT